MRKHPLLSLLFLGACMSSLSALAAPPNLAQLHLADVDQLIQERSRTLLASRRVAAAAAAGVTVAGARPNPTVSLNTSGINTRAPGDHADLDTTVRVDQPIERGGKRALRVGVADALLAASRSDEFDSLRQQRLLAREAYFDLKAAEERDRLSADSAALAHQMLAKAELRQRAGDLALADVARIRTDTLRAEGDATQALVDHQRAQRVLASLLAMEPDATRIVTADPWPRLTPLPPSPADSDARPDVVAARQRVEAAEKAVDLARAQQVRDVTVGAQWERNNQTPAGNLVGVGISIPLFTGYDFRGEMRQAQVALDTARDELERVRAAAAAEVQQSDYEADRLSIRARQLRDEALPAAHRADSAIQLAFSQGAASVLEVIDARRSLHAVEIESANALADAAKARAACAAAANRQELP